MIIFINHDDDGAAPAKDQSDIVLEEDGWSTQWTLIST
jgi:hypothetical protein